MSKWRDGCTMLEAPLEEDGLVVEVHGEVDISSSGELRQLLRNAVGIRRILVDLGDVTFIDSTAMASIVGAHRRLPEGGRLAVVANHHYVLLVLEAVGLRHAVAVFPTREEAETYLNG